MSDTPRTDAIKKMRRDPEITDAYSTDYFVPAWFAGQLERELAFVRKELSEAREMEMMKAQQCTAERLRANAAEEKLRRG